MQPQATSPPQDSSPVPADWLELLPQIVWSSGADGRLEYVNRRWTEYTGLDVQQTRDGGLDRVIHPDDRGGGDEAWARAFAAAEAFQYEYRFRRASDGAYRWHLARCVPVRDAAGRVTRWVGTSTDIDAQKQAERTIRCLTGALEMRVEERTRELARANAELEAENRARRRAQEEFCQAREAAEAANAAKGRFLANMSHEIRTPLNGVLGLTNLVLDTELTADQREHLRLVKSSADALLTVLNDILDFSKIEAGKLDLEALDFDPRATLGDAVRVLEARAREKGLTLGLLVDPSAPDRLVGDPGRLRQAVLNLAGNAVKFTERGGVVVSVRMDEIGKRKAEGGNQDNHGAGVESTISDIRFPISDISSSEWVVLHVEVTDTGIGVPADKLEAIFRPFVQADGSTTRQYGGTGLGLAITAQLAGLMGGRVWAESEVGRGSTFHFTARLGRGKAAAPAPPQAAPFPRPALRILLAEDNSINQRVAVRLLEKHGHAVAVVGDGRAAVDAVGRGRFDLVLMDVEMPEMDGLQATAAIRERERRGGGRAPIIAMTAHAMRGDRERCLGAGMDGYVTKPVQPSALLRAIDEALAGMRPGHDSIQPVADSTESS